MDYGKALRVSRAIAGLQQFELAKKAGLDASYISLIESGRRKPGRKAILSLSAALGLPPNLFTLLAAEHDDLSLTDPGEYEQLTSALTHLLFSPKGEVEVTQDGRT